MVAATQTTADQVVDWIIDRIRRRELVPGQRLVEAALAREFGVGTVPVREALRMLAGDGVVEILPNRGARICVMDRKQVADMLKAMMGLFFVALEELEKNPDSLAAVIPELHAICARMDKLDTRGSTAEILEAMQEYMLAIVAASGNTYIANALNHFQLAYYNLQLLRFVGPISIHKNSVDHRQLTAALERGQFARARKILADSRDRAIVDLFDRPASPA